ncbi:GyrI-like domain-containing protein [Pseudomonas luteola]|nr:GyrI-like domain-containing protein [Pseudomonas luteola]
MGLSGRDASIYKETTMPLSITELPAFTVMGLEYTGDGQGGSLAQLWHDVTHRLAELQLPSAPQQWFGLTLSPPPGVLRYLAGIKVDENTPVPEGMLRYTVPAQKYLQFTHIGTTDTLPDTYEYLYARVLPERGLEPKKAVSFERYDEHFKGPDNPASEVNLYIPIY